MKSGKLPNNVLKDKILTKFKHIHPDVLIGPGIGQDSAQVDFGENILVITTDPITGASTHMGRIGIHVACNDIAAAGGEVIGVTLTMLAPLGSCMEEIEAIAEEAGYTAAALGIDILGGHTEVTDAVNRIVLSVTAIGRINKTFSVEESRAIPGDAILMTKTAGLEGTAILAGDREKVLLTRLDPTLISRAKGFINQISVIPEGRIAVARGALCMHDVTEGGILGALWEISEMLEAGIVIDSSAIPIAQETTAICDFFGIDPLKLISSGSMVIVAREGEILLKALKAAGIDAAIIGHMTGDMDKVLLVDGMKIPILEPDVDELYRALE